MRKCMEKDKRKKALQVACTVFVFLCVVFAMYKLIKECDTKAKTGGDAEKRG